MSDKCDITFMSDMKERRIAKGLSQYDMAAKCSVSLVTYQNWERGITKRVCKENYERLMNILGD